MRYITPLALILATTLCCAATATAQEDSRPSFAKRLASIRLGWGGSDEERESPREAVQASVVTSRSRMASAQRDDRTDLSARLPRLDPSDLLPGERFASEGSTPRTGRRPTTAHLRHNANQRRGQSAVAGSARSRIMRDLRVQATGETEVTSRVASREAPASTHAGAINKAAASDRTRLAPRPQGPASPVVLGRSKTTRAGSVLSARGNFPNPTEAIEPPTAVRPPVIHEADLRRELLGPAAFAGNGNRERADAKTAKSVAAAVASSMAAEAARADHAEEKTEAPVAAPSTEAAVAAAPIAAQTEQPVEPSAQEPLAQEAVETPVKVVTEVASQPEPAAEPAAKSAIPKVVAPETATPGRYAATSLPPIPSNAANEQPAPDAAPSVANETVAQATPREAWRNAGSDLPAVGPPAEAAKSHFAEPPASTSAAVQPQGGFEQDVARRRFDETLDQSLEARTASPQPAWNTTTRNVIQPPPVASAASRDRDTNLLMSQRMPQIVSRVSGPKQIVIGREAVYRVTVVNRGDESADQLFTTISVPEWAEVAGSRSTAGLVEPPATDDGATKVLWRMAELPPGKVQHLDLKLIARQGRPIELGVNWKHAPVGSRTVVQVQEPKLAVSLEGPDEVLFGKPQVFRLHVSNPGTGPAEDVRVRVLPPGNRASNAAAQSLGDLLPNESRTIEFKVTGSESGDLKLQAQAVALGDLADAATMNIFCRKPELEVDWRGPARKYAGASATYYFRVRNPGTATAEGVEFRVNLPAGFEIAKASSNGRVDSTGRQMRWGVGSLRAGDDYYMELQGVINQPGVNEFALGAVDNARMASSSATAATEVIALADLKLDIRDPRGPLPVGDEAVYEVRVRNNGANAAKRVKIVGLFSQGIEPYRVEGAQASIADGRVAVRTIESLTVGSELVLMIHAKATKPGAHIFRAEVLCQDLDIKLAAEETTRFYTEERINLGDGPAHSAGVADRFSTPR